MKTRMLALAVSLLALAARALAQDVVEVSPAPSSFTYTIEEVYFKHPHTYKRTAAKIEKSMIATKVTIHGEGFRQMDTGPVVWLNGIRSQTPLVSPDGRIVEAWFFQPFPELRKGRDAWDLVFQQKLSSPRLLIKGPDRVRRLTAEEWRHARELGKEYGVDVPEKAPE